MKIKNLIHLPKKGKACKKGTLSIEVKIGKTLHRLCIRGKTAKMLIDLINKAHDLT